MSKWVLTGLFAAAVTAFTLSTTAVAQDKKEKVYSIEEIMKKGHAGGKSLIKGITTQVKEGNWDEAQKGAKLLKAFGESLGKNKPEKGDDASWKKLTEQYKENTAAVAAAAEKKDAKAANEALGKIGKSCKECHDAHK